MLYADLIGIVDRKRLIGDSALKATIGKSGKRSAGSADAKGLRAIPTLGAAKQGGKATRQHFPPVCSNILGGRVNCRILVNTLKQVCTLLEKSQPNDSAILGVR